MKEAMGAWRERLGTVLRSPWAGKAVRYVLVPVLLLASLWLPPFSLGVRLFHTDYPQVGAAGGTVAAANGAKLTIPAGALGGKLRLLASVLELDDEQAGKGAVAEALEAVPENLEVLGPLYHFDAHGKQPTVASLVAPLPAGLEDGPAGTDALDIYTWTGEAWEWVPSRLLGDAQHYRATLPGVPRLLAAMKNKPGALAVGVGAPDVAAVNAAPLDLAAELYIAGLSLGGDGSVTGEIKLESAPGDLLVLPTLTNRVGGAVRADWVAKLIADPEARTAHVAAILEAVSRGGYRGLNLEYSGLERELADSLAAFVDELASGLHQAGKVLAVRVDEPRQAPNGGWETAGYDWPALGRAADLVRIPVVNDPEAYGPDGAMERCLREAVNQIDRHKLQIVVSANSTERAGKELRPLCYGDALSLASQLLVADEGTVILPGEKLAVKLANLASGLQETEGGDQSWFAFTDREGVEHKVWIENSSSVANKLALAGRFHLRGVGIDDLAGTANDAHIWETVRIARSPAARGPQAGAAAPRYSVAWRVQGSDGQVVDQGVSSPEQPIVNWTAVEDPGEYVLTVAISEDGGQTTLGEPGSLEVTIPTPTPSPSPVPTDTPAPKPTAKPGAEPAPAPPPPAPAGRVGFGYGIQVDMTTDLDYERTLNHVQALGFGWIKQQIEWFRFNPAPGQYDWGRMDAIVDACSARGIKILFSVCKAPEWTGPGCFGGDCYGPPADPNTYAEFMKQMAARYKGRVHAYEIWNEQNLWYEWGGRGGRLSAAKYVELLRASYHAIKSVDANAIVISGALTPTGWSDGDTAIDDQLYLRQMYQAGLKSVCDAIGAHPSGYNNPPDADWRTWSDPSTGRAKGHPSWFFRSTMEGYRNIMVANGDGNKRIIPTEFGWATVEGLGVPPAVGYEYAADNTLDEQAQFITRAYQMGRNWGFVGPMFLWNLNFAPLCGPGDEKSAFGIVDSGWGPRPSFHALANMPK